jgi:hypothetical protein
MMPIGVRFKYNDSETELYILRAVVYSPINSMVGICEVVFDTSFAKKGEFKEIPLKSLIALEPDKVDASSGLRIEIKMPS